MFLGATVMFDRVAFSDPPDTTVREEYPLPPLTPPPMSAPPPVPFATTVPALCM